MKYGAHSRQVLYRGRCRDYGRGRGLQCIWENVLWVTKSKQVCRYSRLTAGGHMHFLANCGGEKVIVLFLFRKSELFAWLGLRSYNFEKTNITLTTYQIFVEEEKVFQISNCKSHVEKLR